MAETPAFDVAVDGRRGWDAGTNATADAGTGVQATADAGTDAQIGSSIPFRLLPGAASIGEAIEGGGKGRPSDDTCGAGYWLLIPPEDSCVAQRSGSPWRLVASALVADDTPGKQPASQSPARSPDWAGIARDTALFVGYQGVAVAFLAVLPEDVSLWRNTTVSAEDWWQNVSRPPVWDHDGFTMNYILHPYWGATYYIRARERGFNQIASFGYSLLLSTMYEYGVEAFFERPSGQDLLVTPILGSLIGAFVFEPVRNWVKRKPEFRWYDQALLIATDPFGTLNSVVERVLGIKSEILLRPSPPSSAAHTVVAGERRPGVRAQGFSVSIVVPLD